MTRLIPAHTPRDKPRRPVGVDLRPMTKQAMWMFGVVPVAIGSYSLLNHHRRYDFFLGFRVGVVVVALFCTACWAVSVHFEGQHLDESAAFWAQHEAYIRPLAYYGHAAAGSIACAGGLASALFGWAVLAGIFAAVTAYCLFIVLFLRGRVP